ncbi:winged helix-turn-helix domain-containing protein, partial [Streptomyces sp. NPDC057910]|uniref:helix-turn-helix domain-containing protein n=1 Tax=Streptomyces sp. NPDC057910 TaxID=3346278 RepID=UPI0036E9007B
FEDDQRWTLKRVKLLIGPMFHVGYTVQGAWKLLRRHGRSCQVPVRRAVERDGAAVEVWKQEVWPEAEEWRRTRAPTSASRNARSRRSSTARS